MGHSRLDGAHTHGSSGNSVLDGLAQLVAVVVLGVAAIDVVMWVLHVLVIIAAGVGFLVLGSVVGYAAVKYRQFKRRRMMPPARQPYPVANPPAGHDQLPAFPGQMQALPSGRDVHLHLHGTDAKAVLRAITGSGGDAR